MRHAFGNALLLMALILAGALGCKEDGRGPYDFNGEWIYIEKAGASAGVCPSPQKYDRTMRISQEGSTCTIDYTRQGFLTAVSCDPNAGTISWVEEFEHYTPKYGDEYHNKHTFEGSAIDEETVSGSTERIYNYTLHNPFEHYDCVLTGTWEMRLVGR